MYLVLVSLLSRVTADTKPGPCHRGRSLTNWPPEGVIFSRASLVAASRRNSTPADSPRSKTMSAEERVACRPHYLHCALTKVSPYRGAQSEISAFYRRWLGVASDVVSGRLLFGPSTKHGERGSAILKRRSATL